MTTQHRETFNFLTLVWTHEDWHTSSTPTSAYMNMFIPRFLLVTITLFWVNKSTLKSNPLVIKSSSWEELTALISQRFTEEFTWRDPTEETSGSGGVFVLYCRREQREQKWNCLEGFEGEQFPLIMLHRRTNKGSHCLDKTASSISALLLYLGFLFELSCKIFGCIFILMY